MRLGLGGGLVIIADQMQKAMYDHMRRVIGQAFVLLPRLARDGLEGDHYVAEQRLCRQRAGGREGEDIGRLVLPAPRRVEPAYLGVVAKDDAQLAVLRQPRAARPARFAPRRARRGLRGPAAPPRRRR